MTDITHRPMSSCDYTDDQGFPLVTVIRGFLVNDDEGPLVITYGLPHYMVNSPDGGRSLFVNVGPRTDITAKVLQEDILKTIYGALKQRYGPGKMEFVGLDRIKFIPGEESDDYKSSESDWQTITG